MVLGGGEEAAATEDLKGQRAGQAPTLHGSTPLYVPTLNQRAIAASARAISPTRA